MSHCPKCSSSVMEIKHMQEPRAKVGIKDDKQPLYIDKVARCPLCGYTEFYTKP